MAMLTSLFTAISGMNANGISLSVIGDNIANLNTIGFKGSRTAFGDILSQTLSGTTGSDQIGRGVMLSDISPIFTQGSFENTGNTLDLAVDGNGFFIVSDNGARFYTRAGQFSLDRDGYLVNPDELRVQGYSADSAGNILPSLSDIQINVTLTPPRATQQVGINANLDSRSSIIVGGFDITDPNGTSNFSTSLTVYDSLGIGHDITSYFTKTAANNWSWNVVGDASEVSSTVFSGNNALIASGAITFTTNGELDTESGATYYNAGGTGIDFNGATIPQVVAFDFGTSITTDGGTGLDGTTQFGSESATLFLSQDGFASGTLSNLNIDEDGMITGIFTNGQSRVLAQVAIAKFNAPKELIKVGRNLFGESFASGQSITGAPSAGGLGRILSHSLELSNVDLAEEFIKMISAQRGFQANSTTITTTDDLLQEVLNIKR